VQQALGSAAFADALRADGYAGALQTTRFRSAMER
jgi:hypothetical protein